MSKKAKIFLALSLGAWLASTNANAEVFLFTANCNGKKIVEQWTTLQSNPGKEALRAKTQEKHPGCSIADYKAATDAAELKNTQYYDTDPPPTADDGFFTKAKKTLCGMLYC